MGVGAYPLRMRFLRQPSLIRLVSGPAKPGRNWFSLIAVVLSATLVAIALLLITLHFKSVSDARLGLPIPVSSLIADEKFNPESPDASILASLDGQKTSLSADGNSEGRIWVKADINECEIGKTCVLDFRFVRSNLSRFWLVEKIDGRNVITAIADSQIRQANIGITIDFSRHSGETKIVGYIHPQSRARLTAFQWESNDLFDYELSFERTGGVLLGSLLFLAVFSATLAGLYKDIPFLLLAGWLVLMLRVAAVNGGWDLYWFGFQLSRESNLFVLRATLAMCGFLNAAMFTVLFSNSLAYIERVTINTLLTIFCCLILISPFVGQALFSSMYWPTIGIAIVITLAISGRQATLDPKGLAGWFFGTWIIVTSGAAADILFAKGLLESRVQFLNLQTAAISAGFIMAIALANRMQAEKSSRVSAQSIANSALKKYQENYDKVPVGLFTLLPTGLISQHNPAFAKMFGVQPNASLTWDALIPDYPLARLNPDSDARAE